MILHPSNIHPLRIHTHISKYTPLFCALIFPPSQITDLGQYFLATPSPLFPPIPVSSCNFSSTPPPRLPPFEECSYLFEHYQAPPTYIRQTCDSFGTEEPIGAISRCLNYPRQSPKSVRHMGFNNKNLRPAPSLRSMYSSLLNFRHRSSSRP